MSEPKKPKTSIELELESLKVHKDAYEKSIAGLQANQNTDPLTLKNEQKSLREISGRIDELGRIKAAAGGVGTAIPSVQ